MQKTNLIPFIFLMVLVINPGCQAWVALTSSYHAPKKETPGSILHFAKKSNIDGYPILRYDTSFNRFDNLLLLPDFQFYNKAGQFLSLTDTLPGCPDKKQNYMAMKYILQHGDEHFRLDAITRQIIISKDTNRIDDHNQKFYNKSGLNSSSKEIHTKTIDTHLNKIAPYLRTLNKEDVSIMNMYSDYLALNEFALSGNTKVQNYLLRQKIHDIKKLNKDFGNRIQLVLINLDQME